MANLAAEIIAAAMEAMPDGVCSIRVGKSVVQAFTSGLQEVRTGTDAGMVEGYSGIVRYASAGAPSIDKGQAIEIKRAHDAAYITVRVAAVKQIGGAVSLTIAAEYE
jgi:hypothetical protein